MPFFFFSDAFGKGASNRSGSSESKDEKYCQENGLPQSIQLHFLKCQNIVEKLFNTINSMSLPLGPLLRQSKQSKQTFLYFKLY